MKSNRSGDPYISGRFSQFWAVVIGVWISSAVIAGVAATKPAKFDMTVKMNMSNPQMKQGPMTMNMSGTVWYKNDNKMRVEMNVPMMGKMGGGKQITIVSGNDVYQLRPDQKIAMKMKKGTGMASQGPFGSTSGLPDPEELMKKGYKKTGTGKVGNEMCDIYKGKETQQGVSADMTYWLRQKGDHFPLRMEMKANVMGGSMTMTGDIKNIVQNAAMDESLFKVPAGYKIQDASAMMGKMKAGPPPGKR